MINMIEDPYFVKIRLPDGRKAEGVIHHTEDGIFLECELFGKEQIEISEVSDAVELKFIEDPRFHHLFLESPLTFETIH